MPIVEPKSKLAISVALCFLMPGLAWSQVSTTSVSTGREGGNYYYIGKRLHTAMLLENDIQIRVETSSGSTQNLARLADAGSRFGLALTQSDALSRFLQHSPEFANRFIVLGDAGKECAILIAGKSGGVESFAQLKMISDGEVAVDDPGSGAAVTFGYLKAMDPDLARTKPVFVDTMEALLQIKVAGVHTKLKAVMFVQRPSARSAPVEVLLEHSDDYQVVPITASDVQNSTLPDDSVVYTFEKVKVGGPHDRRAIEVETICTRSLLIASKEKLDRETRSKLSSMMLDSSKAIIGPAE